MAAAAQRAGFAPDPRRRALLAKVHLGKNELRLVDDDYRQILLDETGKTSAGDCSEAELVKVVERMKSRGFQARPARPGQARPADHPSARKARALWISLHQLGAIDNPSEQALEAFAKRQLKVDRLQWANQPQAYKLIEALKSIGDRNGWNTRVQAPNAAAAIAVMKRNLCEAILAKLQEEGLASMTWDLATAAFRLLGFERSSGPLFWTVEDLELVAAGLGRKLRGGR